MCSTGGHQQRPAVNDDTQRRDRTGDNSYRQQMPDCDRDQRLDDDRPTSTVEAEGTANSQPIAGLTP